MKHARPSMGASFNLPPTKAHEPRFFPQSPFNVPTSTLATRFCALFVHLEPAVAFRNGDVSDRGAKLRFINEFMRQAPRSKSAAICGIYKHSIDDPRVLGYPLGKIAISSRALRK